MALITIHELSIGFGGPPLLDSACCQIEPGQRIGLWGRNGAGKTTFLRILAKQVEPDGGRVQMDPMVRVSLLPQDVPRDLQGSVREVVAHALPEWDPGRADPWKAEIDVDQIISRMSLEADARVEILSTGMQRRVLLARTLVAKPDVLLLDEPTNHLDITAIEWLEAYLSRWRGTLLFVTHDRVFLRNVASRILEVERGLLFDWSCDYDTFLRRKEAALAAESKQNALLDKRLAEEEVWIRQGIKARRTRNEGRVRALEQLRRQYERRRDSQGQARWQIQEAQRSGNLVAVAEEIEFGYDNRPLISGFSTMIMRGDKVGLIGSNGVGKTTLLKLLLGRLAPQRGSVRLGTNLQIAYFDQLRSQLDEAQTVQDNVADGYETIQMGGVSKHVLGYLRDFLFSSERARTPVRFLSGGEKNRLLLARLFAKPANVIVLDEPTNDLDTESLELLESRLVEYTGTVLLVSHDREFLNNVVTSSIVFEPSGVHEFVGGYDDWLRQRETQDTQLPDPPVRKTTRPQTKSTPDAGVARKRLSYKEQQELQALPGRIEEFERRLAELHATMADPAFFRQPGAQIAREHSCLRDLQQQLDECFERWANLEERA